ncbi:MAG TPA: hypothetical protein VGC74_11260 [Stenotrophomonas sp.]
MSELPVETQGAEVTAVPRKMGHKWADVVMAVTAIFISLVSLAVAIEHGRTTREMVAANTWPFMQEMRSNAYEGHGDVAIGLSNGGVGPAKIKYLEVFYRGQPMKSGMDLLRHCCGLPADPVAGLAMLEGMMSRSNVDETVIRPGEANAVLRVDGRGKDAELPKRFAEAIKDVSFQACYCSVLDECWTSDLHSTRTVEVEECEVPKHRFDPLAD